MTYPRTTAITKSYSIVKEQMKPPRSGLVQRWASAGGPLLADTLDALVSGFSFGSYLFISINCSFDVSPGT